ncbi:ATP-binding protein, partial [Thermodesulfobacteriota bacterium]
GSITLSADLVESSKLKVQSSNDAFQLSASDFEQHRDWIKISVQDTGIGISPEEQKEVFKDFYQVKGGVSGKTSGTGMGLSLAKRLVELHGGRIWIESEGEGKGSRFVFLIPFNA